ncbi:Crp/Fnr family transcriptional regulator [Hyphomicrobium sulfonivorans]|uniref:Transcriptional regulatory protein n=1 Tax=Hyphomicrobium sulfonivorans TaxID=121290 RepID=A0A109BG56_HYPSL|nr:Crp/Fnr family transcriptional regulator [Hyphomicrobium sulfonivorans]KWT67532.1 transcriptional regulatory protein [Hyphomicrobium sulfonivorans]MBI1649367.1 Crp/Fnr family transcriptional regulator [Hyphomicrobium sulfonivorans]
MSAPASVPSDTPRLDSYADKITSVIYSKGQTIFDADQINDVIFQVISGAVVVTRLNAAGQREVIEVAGPGAVLGMVSGPHYGCKAEALTRSTLASIGRSAIENSPQLQRRIGWALTRKLEKLQEESRTRMRTSATASVAKLVLSLPSITDKVPHERVALPQADMASYLGLAIETVCRAIKALKQSGAIQTTRRDKIVITDPGLLQRFCDEQAGG